MPYATDKLPFSSSYNLQTRVAASQRLTNRFNLKTLTVTLCDLKYESICNYSKILGKQILDDAPISPASTIPYAQDSPKIMELDEGTSDVQLQRGDQEPSPWLVCSPKQYWMRQFFLENRSPTLSCESTPTTLARGSAGSRAIHRVPVEIWARELHKKLRLANKNINAPANKK
ncbi:unnamed protein product, partial [Owenia fusiformis]